MSEAIDCIRNASLAAGAPDAYRPNGYLRVVAAILSLRSDVGLPRGSGSFFIFARKYCAMATGEPNCDLMNHVAAVIARPEKALAFAAFLSDGLMRCSGSCFEWRRCRPPAARKPITAAPASAHGEVSERRAERPVCFANASTRCR